MGRKRKKGIKRSHPPGTLPGTLVAHAEADAVPVQIFMFSYGPDRCEERALRPEEIPSLAVPENGVLWLGILGVGSFRERAGAPFDPIRDPLRKGLGRLRSAGADYLAYSLCDGIVDSFFPTLEKLGDEVEELEERVMASPYPETFRDIRQSKRMLLEVRRAVWPARAAMNELLREASRLIPPAPRGVLRGCV